MDNKEAIRVIRRVKSEYVNALEFGRVPTLHKDLYEKYIKSYDLAIQALEKQIPKQVIDVIGESIETL